MGVDGGCHCRAVRYTVAAGAVPVHHALCHCRDCRRASGAPAVSWALFAKDQVTINGATVAYASSPGTERHFCGRCGTSLFFTNETIFPGQIDLCSATLDDPDAYPLGAVIQTADRIGWMERLDALPHFARYPG